MKIKKLDTWIHSELEPRIGELWYLWKLQYDFLKIYQKESNPEIWINENGNEFLVLYFMDTPDAGLIPVIGLDSLAPASYIDSILYETFINKCGYNVVANSRGDLLINLSTFVDFNEYKNSISSQKCRYWNKCEKNFTFEEIDTSEFQKMYILMANYKYHYWNNKTSQYTNLIEPDIIANQFFTNKSFILKDRTEPIAFSFFCVQEDEVLWFNTFQHTDYRKYAIGNYMLLKSIQYFFNYKYFNMGLHVFDYKQKWLVEYRPVKGIRKFK